MAIFGFLLTIAMVMPGQAQNSDRQPIFGPDAVTSLDDAGHCLREFRLDDFRACLADAGASSAAIDAAVSLTSPDSPVILSGYLPIGPVDIVEITIPQAGSGTKYGLSVRGERFVPIDRLLSPMDVRDSASARLRTEHPQATVGSFGRVAGHRYLEGGGQRFVLTWPLVDGCRACPVIGEAIGYVDYRGGEEVGSDMVGWTPVRGEYPTQPAEIRRRLQAGDTLELQTQLNLRGYIAGTMDGVYGGNSGRALQQFQAEHCIDSDRFTQEAAGLLSDADFRDTRLVEAPCGPEAPGPASSQNSPRNNGSEPVSATDAGSEAVAGLTIENSGPDLFNVFNRLMSEFCVGREDCYYFTRRDEKACEVACSIEGVEGIYVGRKIAAGTARGLLDRSGQQMKMLTQQGVPRGFEGRVNPDEIGRASAYRMFREGCEEENCDSMLVFLFDENSGFIVDVKGQDGAGSSLAGGLMSAIEGFRERADGIDSFGDFISELAALKEGFDIIGEARDTLDLFESSLTPRIAAEAEFARTTQSGLLFIGAHVSTFLVKDMYARAEQDPENAPRIIKIVPERVALATMDAAFNISSAVVTGGASALIGQTISTTTNIVDAVIAYKDLGQETDQLVEQTLEQTARAVQQYREGDLPEDVALRQFELTQTISEELASGWAIWGPSVDASNRLAIIAGLARIKVLEGDPPMSPRDVLGTGDLRVNIATMGGQHCFSCLPEYNQRYQIFADRVARDFAVRGWEPMASPGLLDDEWVAERDEADSEGDLEGDLSRIEDHFTAALGVDSEAVQSWLQEADFLSGAFAPLGPEGRHAEWTPNVESAFRDTLEYAVAEGVTYDLSDKDGYYQFVRDVRDHRLTPADGSIILMDEALGNAVDILLGDPYGQTREEVLGNIAGARIEREDACGAEIAWVFDIHVPDLENMNGQAIRGDLSLDALTGQMSCAGLPFLR